MITFGIRPSQPKNDGKKFCELDILKSSWCLLCQPIKEASLPTNVSGVFPINNFGQSSFGGFTFGKMPQRLFKRLGVLFDLGDTRKNGQLLKCLLPKSQLTKKSTRQKTNLPKSQFAKSINHSLLVILCFG